MQFLCSKVKGTHTFMIVDLHCHILPEMDDGSNSVEMSAAMLCRMAEQGIDFVCATSHYYAEENTIQTFCARRNAAMEQLQAVLPEEMPPLDVEASPRPECSDSLLVQKIVEKIEAYQTEHPSTMLIDRRRDILLRRNLSRFDEVKVEGFTAKQDFNVANAVIMTKINRGLNDADLRLCKSLGHGRAAGVYALIYPVGEGNVVDIINFLPGENLSFIYD